MSSVPSLSALQFKGHSFPIISLRANQNGTATGQINMQQEVSFLPVPNEPNSWNLQLHLCLTSANPGAPFFYDTEILAIGLVEIVGEIAAEKREITVAINGLGILYSACREMILNISARSVFGGYSIPSLNFGKVIEEAKKAQMEKKGELVAPSK